MSEGYLARMGYEKAKFFSEEDAEREFAPEGPAEGWYLVIPGGDAWCGPFSSEDEANGERDRPA